ncbi:MAG TPA: hypothetical protein VMV45_09815 [Casimicrobiaceae bacterium]|nr:hypothetical protein [Casimicrobiaceae bacterium]
MNVILKLAAARSRVVGTDIELELPALARSVIVRPAATSVGTAERNESKAGKNVERSDDDTAMVMPVRLIPLVVPLLAAATACVPYLICWGVLASH